MHPDLEKFPYIPPGEYLAYCCGSETWQGLDDEHRFVLRFSVLDADRPVSLKKYYRTLPSGNSWTAAARSYLACDVRRFFESDMSALEKATVTLGDLPLEVTRFIGERFSVRVRTVTRGTIVPPIVPYSVVDSLLERKPYP